MARVLRQPESVDDAAPTKSERVPLLLSPLEKQQIRDWATARGLPVNNAIRTILYEAGILKPGPAQEQEQ